MNMRSPLQVVLETFCEQPVKTDKGSPVLPGQWFFHVGEQKMVRWCQIRRIMEGDQPVKSHSYAQQPLQSQICVQEHCPGETGLPSTFVSFPSHSRNVSSTTCTFQSPELLIECGFIWNETMQLVSGKVESNACQVALLWHNYLVSLWTFQPILVSKT